MVMTEQDLSRAEQRMQAQRAAGYALAAHYDARQARLVVELSTGIQLAVPVNRLEGLAQAAAGDLAEIEITPTGLGLHWPKLDADVYIPALLQGIFGSKAWMAAQLGAAGGRVATASKAKAARQNGRKGGRPRKALAS